MHSHQPPNPKTPKKQYKLAMQLFTGNGRYHKDVKLAVHYLELAATQDYSRAQLKLAKMYEKGRGVLKNKEIAFRLLHAAATNGNPEAQFQLGKKFKTSESHDPLMAFYWFNKAASQGHAASQFQLAYMYEKSIGVKKSRKMAFYWAQKAAIQGYVLSQFTLAKMYDHDKSKKENKQFAFKWHKIAAEKGHAPSQFIIGNKYLNGLDCAVNKPLGIYWCKKAAKQNYAPAQYNLGTIYETGNGVPVNYQTAAEWHYLAAQQQHKKSLFALGYFYDMGLLEKNEAYAVYYYEQSAKLGYSEAQYELGLRYESGYYVEKNLTKATQLYQDAEALNHLGAQSHLAYMYKEGHGVPKDQKTAHLLYQNVAERIQTETAEISLEELQPKIDPAHTYIPKMWPLPIDQRGPCCGLYALYLAIIYGFQNTISTLPARKDGDEKVRSLRQIVKEKNHSLVGEILNIDTFPMLTDDLKIPDCKVLNDCEIKKEDYIQLICKNLEKNSIIVGCNLKPDNFPGKKSEEVFGAHWALVFGYYLSKEDNKYKFLVTQYGKYFEWDAEALYHSNLEILEGNALRKAKPPHFEKEKWKEQWQAEKDKTNSTMPPCKMRFGLFRVPKLENHENLRPKNLCGVKIFKTG